MPPHTFRDIEHVLRKHGFIVYRQKGSHVIFRHPETKRLTIVPYHGSNTPITIGVFHAILKQTGLKKESF